jgi:hypothetical protein
LVQGQGGSEVKPAGILKYSEDLKRRSNSEIGPKDFFEMASITYLKNKIKAQGKARNGEKAESANDLMTDEHFERFRSASHGHLNCF